MSFFAAFWVAVIGFRILGGGRLDAVRYVGGLVAAAACAHLGWVLMYWPLALDSPAMWFNPTSGFSVLFVPFGLALSSVVQRGSCSRGYEAAAFGALPAALAVARGGCLAAGCCGGGSHPVAVYDLLALLVLAGVASWSATRHRAWVVCAGLALTRLGLDPLRAQPPLGPPSVPVPVVALALVALAGWLAWRERRDVSGPVASGAQPRPA